MPPTFRPDVSPDAKIESLEPKKVVRVFLLQAIDHRLIDENTDLAQMSLMNIVLTKKNEYAKNPRQIMPLGGNVEQKINAQGKKEDETVSKAAVRETLEETHLLVDGCKKLPTTQKYTFTNVDGIQSREVTYFVATLFGPKYDHPYPLDNEEDKIESFPEVPVGALEHSLTEGSFLNDPLVDSLDVRENVRLQVGTHTDQHQVESIHRDIMLEAKSAELTQKIKLLAVCKHSDNLSQELKDSIHEFQNKAQRLEGESEILSLYEKVQLFWQVHIEEIVDGHENMRQALAFLELEHVLDDLMSNQEGGRKPYKGIPTMHMMFSIMFGLEFDKKYNVLIEKHPHLQKLLHMANAIFLYNQIRTSKNDKKVAAITRLLGKNIGLMRGYSITGKDMVAYFKNTFYFKIDMNREVFSMLGEEVDTLFKDLQSQSTIDPNVANLEQKNEVQGKDFNRLVELACMDTRDIHGRQIMFEAQRKLLLTYLFADVRSFYEQVRVRGMRQLDDLESTLEKKIYDPLGSSERTIVLGGIEHTVNLYRDIKTVGSLLRKVLARDSWDMDGDKTEYAASNKEYNDVYRESYTFGENSMPQMNILRDHSVPCKMTDGETKKEITQYNVPALVHSFISQLVDTAKNQNEKLEIEYFKALLENGQKVISNGPGGGGDVRYCKFYMKHTDVKAVVRMREVQMFLPKKDHDGTIVSGKVDHEHKKKDDTGYTMKRLFTYGNTYSLIELLYPHYIYGDRMKSLFPSLKKKKV